MKLTILTQPDDALTRAAMESGNSPSEESHAIVDLRIEPVDYQRLVVSIFAADQVHVL